ncbi:TOBE domain-containing protein [Acidiphilium sp.]|uniref:TOBE domain-containing protein n=1 Tax=Acidiphilium sp. TaxID=527 RepID=UPI00258CDB4C|nr:TOBE domain-containing protein [Acidiphilium sp.]
MTLSAQDPASGVNAFVNEAAAFLDLRGLAPPDALAAGGLAEFSLATARGEKLCLLARDGEAARAVLAMVAGNLRPARGDIIVNGRRLQATPARRRGFGHLPARIVLPRFRRLSAYVAAALAGQPLSGAARAARVARILALVGLAECGAKRGHALTPSERFRAALAHAMIVAPKLLLIAEPDEGFPEPERQMLATLLRGGPAADLTTLIAARTPASVFALADRALVLHEGRIAQIAPPQILYDAPASLAVAEALGEANVLSGVLVENEDDIARVRLECGTIVSGSLAESITIGQRCLLMVRPERIAVAAVAAEELGEGALSAMLCKMIPLGAQTRLFASLGNGTDIIVTRPASAALRGLQPGREMAIAWAAPHARIYAARPSADAA